MEASTKMEAYTKMEAPTKKRNTKMHLTDDGTEPWPSALLHAALAKTSKKQKRCVLLTTGAMNPIHKGHTAMFVQARRELESKHGYKVLAGFISPSHDLYVGPKMRSKGHPHVRAKERVAMCRLAVKEFEWLATGTWEARQVGNWPDYPGVIKALSDHLHSIEGAEDVAVLYGNQTYSSLFFIMLF